MEQSRHENAPDIGVEHVPGCPICEHSDPALERELEEFARLLFEAALAGQLNPPEPELVHDVDKDS